MYGTNSTEHVQHSLKQRLIKRREQLKENLEIVEKVISSLENNPDFVETIDLIERSGI